MKRAINRTGCRIIHDTSALGQLTAMFDLTPALKQDIEIEYPTRVHN